MSTLMFVMALMGAAHAGEDERVAVVVLPAPVSAEVSDAARASLERSLQAELLAMPGFRGVALNPEDRGDLLADPECRAQAACLGAHVPAETDLIVDARLSQAGEAWVLELRLLSPDGAVSRRRAFTISPRALSAQAAAELHPLLAGWSLDARYYAQAVRGDAEAAGLLRARFPDSPYTRALD